MHAVKVEVPKIKIGRCGLQMQAVSNTGGNDKECRRLERNTPILQFNGNRASHPVKQAVVKCVNEGGVGMGDIPPPDKSDVRIKLTFFHNASIFAFYRFIFESYIEYSTKVQYNQEKNIILEKKRMKNDNKKIRVAIIGCGGFAGHFVPLFQAHPTVEWVKVCDLVLERAEKYRKKFGVEIIPSFDDAIADDSINTIAIFTQRHTHGDLVVRALEAGKDVYSAVPMAITVEDCERIIEAVKRTGRIYMMGETCIYYPSSMFCKERLERGDFGKFVYAESQYYHDLSHFPKVFNEDKPNSAVPPFFYPTHSTAMVLHATNTHVVKVTAMGYEDREEDTPFAVGKNPWDNLFSNEFSLMRLSNGGVARVSECRRIGFKAPSSSIQSFYGTEGSYQFSNAQHIFSKLTPTGVELEDVSDYVNPAAMTENKNDSTEFKNLVANHGYQWSDPSPIQQKDYERLPDSYREIPQINGHMASHQLLIHDFCTAVSERKMPYVNAWRAARYTIPGLIAHESAKLGGVPLDVPDFGDPPDEL